MRDKMRKIVKNAIYRHFKGNFYLVIDVATSSEDNKEYVYNYQDYLFLCPQYKTSN